MITTKSITAHYERIQSATAAEMKAVAAKRKELAEQLKEYESHLERLQNIYENTETILELVASLDPQEEQADRAA